MNFNNDDQLKAFLKNESKRLGISINSVYNTYFARLFLERINSNNHGILAAKGGFAQLAHTQNLSRPINDIDLVAVTDPKMALTELYKALYDSNDNVEMELAKEAKETCPGIYKVNAVVNCGKISHPMNIYLQSDEKYDFDLRVIKPIFEGDKSFFTLTPALEACIAEKLCVIAESNKNEALNTRLKDFYDLWKLLECQYNANKVEENFCKMIENRKKTNPNELDTSFLNGDYVKKHQKIWDNIKDKYEFLDDSIPFDRAVKVSKSMLNHEIEVYQRVRKK